MTSAESPARQPRPDHSELPLRLTVREPEDLIAFAPIAVGFEPRESVVMLSLRSPGGGPHARVGIPRAMEDVPEVVEVLLGAAGTNGVELVAFLVYGEDSPAVGAVARALVAGFTAAGIDVHDVIRLADDQWFPLAASGRPAASLAGVPYDVSTHPFTLEAILRGRVVRSSREELVALVRRRPDRPGVPDRVLARAATLPPGEVTRTVQRHVDARTCLDDAELASVAVSIVDPSRRDECWAWLDRSCAKDAADLWTDAVGRLPDEHAGDAAAVLAFVAWLSGDGALAWCAVDRCREVQEHNSLASLVSQLLEGSVSPDLWERPARGGDTSPAA